MCLYNNISNKANNKANSNTIRKTNKNITNTVIIIKQYCHKITIKVCHPGKVLISACLPALGAHISSFPSCLLWHVVSSTYGAMLTSCRQAVLSVVTMGICRPLDLLPPAGLPACLWKHAANMLTACIHASCTYTLSWVVAQNWTASYGRLRTADGTEAPGTGSWRLGFLSVIQVRRYDGCHIKNSDHHAPSCTIVYHRVCTWHHHGNGNGVLDG